LSRQKIAGIYFFVYLQLDCWQFSIVMMRFLLVAFIALLIPLNSYSTHIVGGSLTYEHLGGSTYRVTMKLYKDCGPTSAGFPSSLNVDVYLNDGTPYSTINMPFPGQDTLNPFIDTCAFDPGVCVSQAIYTKVVNNLPPGQGGYHMIYQICCRNASLDNVTAIPFIPGTGTTYYAYIPENAQVLTNSSPVWNNFPPVFVCANEDVNFDHSATDLDGDSLVYSLYHPFEDDAFAFVANQPQFPNIVYNAGFDWFTPLEPSAPATTMTIDPQTGLLSSIPPILGQFVVGIQVEEYRNGVLLSTVYRDFQFNVVNCPPPALAGIGPVDACNGAAVNFVNASTSSANGFFWDFGHAGNTSTLTNPSYTYPGIGTYTVTLIAQYGTPCADTASYTFDISWVGAEFTYVDSSCVNTPITFNDVSTVAANGTINTWNWDFGDNTTSTLPNPTHTYSAGGLYDVWLHTGSDVGCLDSVLHQVYVQGLPTASAGPDTTACMNNPLISLNGIVNNASGGLWISTGGTFNPNPNTLNTDYTPTAAEVAAGSTILILSTTGNGFCPAAVDTIVITFVAGPTADAGGDIQVCKDTAQIPLNGLVTVSGGGVWTTPNGTGTFTPDSTDLNAAYIPSSADTAAGFVTVILTTTNNGNCISTADTITISFFDPPTLAVTVTDTACAGHLIPLNASISTGSGLWVTLGSGSFNPNDSLPITSYMPSASDEAAGNVTLIFTSLNNGGCLAQIDTVDIAIIPSPTPAFTFTEVCLNDPSVFNDQSTSVGTITNWTWDFGDTNGSSQQNPSHTFGTPGTQNVTLVVQSNNGCTDTLTQAVEVYYLPVADFVNPSTCLNGGTPFIDSSTVVGATIDNWNWSFGDNTTDTVQDPLHVYGTAGTYAVSLIVQSSQGCIDTVTQNVTILPGPTAAFSANPTSAWVFESIQFTDQSTPPPISSWYWDFGDTSGTSTDQHPSYAYNAPGNHTVMLVVTDDNGCMDTAYNEVVIFLPPKIPTGFTPNGDGQNDILYVLGGPYTELDYKIYNNWGELIFISNDVTHGWDGTRDGLDQPMGVYVFTVFARTEDDAVHEITGDVTLMR
jgi:gliding motility-associated-like protein